MNKKNIDELFREKLKDFEEIPDEKVWKNISDSLDNQHKSKKRVIPIWWRLGGIAALLAVVLLLVNPFEDDQMDTPEVTDVESTNPIIEESDETRETEEKALPLPNEKNVRPGLEQVINGQEVVDSEAPQGGDRSSTLTVSGDENTKTLPARTQVSKDESAERAVREGVVSATSQKNAAQEVLKKDSKPESSNLIKEAKEQPAVAAEDTGQESTRPEVVDQPEKIRIGEDAVTTEGAAPTEITNSDKDEPEQLREKEGENLKKKSIFEEIEEGQEAVAEKTDGKWSIGPSVAPVYFNSFGEGSPIHSNFAANSKSGNLNLSYGLSVSYELSEKLSLRSGIHKVDYGYDTNDVSFTSSLAATSTQITTIDFASTSKNLVVQSNAGGAAREDLALNSAEVAAPDPSRDGIMNQQFGYLEIPLELNYALVDRKLGVNVIGGFSSLFLVNNSVSLESEGQTTEVGEANNINEVNFSTNIGIGLNYELSPKVRVNLEPMFKYQMNTFSDTAGNFQPFSIGVYSGLSLKF